MRNKINFLNENNSIKFYEKQSKKLIVWFSGVNEPFFSSKLPEITGCDCLYLKDDDYLWYTKGFLHSQSSLEDGISFLKDLISEFSYEKVIFCGQSSGGYAALLYGIKCNVELILAFSPQTKNIFNGQCYMCPSVKIESISSVISNSDFDKRIILNLSKDEKDHDDSFFWDDFKQIEDIKNIDNVTLVMHPYHNHAVSVKLREDGILYKYIDCLVKCYA